MNDLLSKMRRHGVLDLALDGKHPLIGECSYLGHQRPQPANIELTTGDHSNYLAYPHACVFASATLSP